jgi:hypothetical protein
MATAAMACDDLSINRFNPYTWSGTFGVYSDGFPSMIPNDGSYTTEISEEPTVYTDSLMGGVASDPNMNLSGSMYLKTAESSPAPFRGFPARKNEFPDGTVSWARPGQPWSWMGGHRAKDDTWTAGGLKTPDLLIWLALIALVVYLFSRIKK